MNHGRSEANPTYPKYMERRTLSPSLRVSEVLVFEGHAVAATRRPGAALPNANEKPGSRYRDALREAQRRAIETRVGLWGQCVFEDTLVDPLATP